MWPPQSWQQSRRIRLQLLPELRAKKERGSNFLTDSRFENPFVWVFSQDRSSRSFQESFNASGGHEADPGRTRQPFSSGPHLSGQRLSRTAAWSLSAVQRRLPMAAKPGNGACVKSPRPARNRLSRSISRGERKFQAHLSHASRREGPPILICLAAFFSCCGPLCPQPATQPPLRVQLGEQRSLPCLANPHLGGGTVRFHAPGSYSSSRAAPSISGRRPPVH